MTIAIALFPDTYVDSVVQLRCIRAMREPDGVAWASAGMATPANVETLLGEGVAADDVASAGANDFVLVVRANSPEAAEEALSIGRAAFSTSVIAPAVKAIAPAFAPVMNLIGLPRLMMQSRTMIEERRKWNDALASLEPREEKPCRTT